MVSLVMSSAYMCGIRDFDVAMAYEASRKNELEWKNRPRGAGKLDIDRFIKYGYVNHLDTGNDWSETWQFSASHTLEYSFSAYAVAQWAKALGKTEDHKTLLGLSKAWEKIFDPQLKLIRPKTAEGKFIDKFDPSQPWRGFQEGNAWQYTYFVPHQPEALVARLGRETFNARLDSTFRIAEKALFGGGSNIDAFAGIAGIYNHGNQPNLHASWLFNFSGKPSLTQKWVRAICNGFYGTEGVHGYGFGQDEDQGQLGAWYVISSIGLFDVKGLSDIKPSLGIGSPLFDKVTILLNKKYYPGKSFVIDTKNNSKENGYIQKILLNGKAVHQPFISLSDITRGGKLVLEMGAIPVDKY
jgi:predicted alpha-1,2-mannosidase